MDKLKFIIGDALAWVVTHRIAVIGAALIALILAVAAGIDNCRQRSAEKKLDRIESNITEQQTIANVLANAKANVNAEVQRHENNSNLARRDLDNSVRRDSNAFAGDPEDKYCRRFCLDSTCIDWRKRHPGFACN